MTTGYLGGGKCWGTVGEAVDAHWESFPLSTSSNGSGTNYYFRHFVFNDGTGWKLKSDSCYQIWNAPIDCNGSTVSLPAFVPSACTMEAAPGQPAAGDPLSDFTDGNAMGWLVVAAMAVAFGFKQMRRAA